MFSQMDLPVLTHLNNEESVKNHYMSLLWLYFGFGLGCSQTIFNLMLQYQTIICRLKKNSESYMVDR